MHFFLKAGRSVGLVAGLLLCGACAVLVEMAQNPETGQIVAPKMSKDFSNDKNDRRPDRLGRYPFKGTTVAILTFDVRDGISASEVALFAESFEAEFISANVQRTVSRSKMKEVLDLQKFSATCGDNSCAIEAGQLLNVEYMIYGSIGRINKLYRVNIFMTSIEKGEIVLSAPLDYTGTAEGLIRTGVKRSVNAFLYAAIAKGAAEK